MSNKKDNLLEGFVRGTVDGVRRYFAHAPARQSSALRRGGLPNVERAGLPYTAATQFGYDNMSDHLRIDRDLMTRYADYEDMDETVEVSVALDLYADSATMPSLDHHHSMWVSSDNDAIQKELNGVLYDRLLVDEEAWGSTRTLAKYGSNFGEILVGEPGVLGIQFMPPPTVRRVEDPRGNLIGFVQDTRGEFNITVDDYYKLAKSRSDGPYSRAPGEMTPFEDWEVVHWRLRGKHMRSTYGHGVIEAARYTWKRLQLLEDALLIYKLQRAPSRFLFHVDIGKMDAERGMARINRVKSQFKRKRFVNPKTGKLDMRFNPLGMDEDIFVASRDGKHLTDIETLQGPDYSETDTLEYHRSKMAAALKIPKSYLGMGEGDANTALSSSDIRFAQTVMRVQAAERAGWRKVLRVHMLAIGKDPSDNRFDVAMSVPSQILELARVEVLSAKADLAGRMGEDVSSRWVMTRLYGFSEREAEQVMKEKADEKMVKAKAEAQAQGFANEDVEPRLSEFVHATPREPWDKEFEGIRKHDARLDSKIEATLKNDRAMRNKLVELGSLMKDIRAAMVS